MNRLPVFNRIHDRRVHPYESILGAILDGNSTVVEDRAVARNLSHDHRVTPRRGKILRHYFSRQIDKKRSRPGNSEDVPTRDDLVNAMKQYFSDCIQTKSDPEFSSPKLNGKNILKHPDRRPRTRNGTLGDDDLLVNVFDLNGLTKVYINAAEVAKLDAYSEWRSVFEGLEIEGGNVGSWLDKKLDHDPDAPPEKRLIATEAQKTVVGQI